MQGHRSAAIPLATEEVYRYGHYRVLVCFLDGHRFTVLE